MAGDCHQRNITLERVFPLIQHGGAQSRPTKEYFLPSLPTPLFLATTVLDAYKPLLGIMRTETTFVFSFLPVFYCFFLHISLFIKNSEQLSFVFFEKKWNEYWLYIFKYNIIRSDQNSDAASIFTGWFSSVGLEIPRKSKNQAKQRVQCFLREKFE